MENETFPMKRRHCVATRPDFRAASAPSVAVDPFLDAPWYGRRLRARESLACPWSPVGAGKDGRPGIRGLGQQESSRKEYRGLPFGCQRKIGRSAVHGIRVPRHAEAARGAHENAGECLWFRPHVEWASKVPVRYFEVTSYFKSEAPDSGISAVIVDSLLYFAGM